MIVRAFHEKVQSPPGNLANAAVYILTSKVVRRLEKLGSNVIDFSVDIIPQLIGLTFCIETHRYLRDIGSIESLLLAEKEFGIQEP
jgi:mannose-1-phosphate guanylyltransferase